MSLVFDASALLAVALAERGGEAGLKLLLQPGGKVSAVNWSEVGAKLAERGLPAGDMARELSAFGLDVIAFDEEQANLAAALRPVTRPLGLSLGDRSCLALAQLRGAGVVTADANWKKLDGFDVIAVRGD
jgi:PIN domain nuclease of toxin-antitoxin system